MDCLLEVKSAHILGIGFLRYYVMLCKTAFRLCSAYTHVYSNCLIGQQVELVAVL